MTFLYKRRDKERLQATVRERHFDGNFKKALRDAHKGNPKQLGELLRLDNPLSEEHRAELADLIEWHLQRRSGKGRPRGSILNSPSQEIEQQIILIAQRNLAQIRKPNGGKAPRGAHEKAIQEAVNLACKIYEGEPGLNDVSLTNIRNALKRGKRLKPAAR